MSDVSGQRTLHRLIYASRQRINPSDLDHEVGGIIRASIRNNRAVAITGLLLIHEGWFLQSLEGPATAVMTTYGRIIEDPRHSDPTLISAGPALKREFGDWNMCARGMSAADDAIVRTLSARAAFQPETFSAEQALKLLTSVRGIQARTERQAVA